MYYYKNAARVTKTYYVFTPTEFPDADLTPEIFDL